MIGCRRRGHSSTMFLVVHAAAQGPTGTYVGADGVSDCAAA